MSSFSRVIVFALTLAGGLHALPATAADDAEPAKAAPARAMPDNMKQYWFVMLSKGPRRGEAITPEQSAELQAGHMAHMSAQHEAGRLVMAGPFGDDGDWRGIQIYDAASKQEVEALCAEDPAVKAGRLACEVRPWWGQVGTALK